MGQKRLWPWKRDPSSKMLSGGLDISPSVAGPTPAHHTLINASDWPERISAQRVFETSSFGRTLLRWKSGCSGRAPCMLSLATAHSLLRGQRPERMTFDDGDRLEDTRPRESLTCGRPQTLVITRGPLLKSLTDLSVSARERHRWTARTDSH